MTRHMAFALPAVLALVVAGPGTAAAQHTRGAGSTDSGQSTSRSSPPPSAPSGGSTSSGAGSSSGSGSSGGADSSAPAPRAVQRGGSSRTGSGRSTPAGQARPRNPSGDTAGPRGDGDGRTRATGSTGDSGGDVPPYSRPREGRNRTGQAVERRGGAGGGSSFPIIIDNGGYYGGFYPWGWGGLGFGGYYGGFYDPWWYDPYPTNYSYGYEGALRIKVKPKVASVYVDGYFAGEVDDFDGVFQRLHMDSGPHRVELREEGYEPLTFEVRIQPDRTVTYKGEMRKLP